VLQLYVIAENDTTGTAERAFIDLHPARLGRCYDAFWDCFAVVGSMTVVATSFADLLARPNEADGDAYRWNNTSALGDAYD